ncbi:DUF2752 domain-containing protein [Ancylomarina euxinus]|uniref:DUF2752 domain-containing protein n=1 Tax=Ancylomarina euxinus TaxID=2283627 RepID=A0A425Y660_9BACT|nr:DUF2752 domain-containing protein [Ancylomarina euxinus]RRG23721.1 DUF2752 domain-containing protein [Ancylomarina euxinus]
MWNKLIQWIETHSLSCQFYQNYQIECPGCGLQSAFISLLKGNLLESIQTYPALIPLILLIISLAAHIKFRSIWTIKSNRILVSITLLLILINYINKLI